MVDHRQHEGAERIKSHAKEPQIICGDPSQADEDVRTYDGNQRLASLRVNYPLG